MKYLKITKEKLGITDISKAKIIFMVMNQSKKRFSVKKNYVNKFKKLKSQVVRNSKYAIVHIRLKDYKTFGPTFLNGPDLSLPFEYYHKLIKRIPKDFKIVFLSDDIKKIKNEFNYVDQAYFQKII